MSDAQEQAGAGGEAQEAELSALDMVLQATPKQKPDVVKDLMSTLTQEATKGTVSWDKSVTRTLDRGIHAIDEAISKQVAAVMHNEAFQKLEGSWRGLHHLVFESETSKTLKIKVLNGSKKAIYKDLDKAVEFDQSTVFKKLYEDEFGHPGGEPYGALIGDYEFGNTPQDIDFLRKMSGVAAASFCPFLSAADPDMFGLDSFSELSKPRDIEKIFDTKAYTGWRSFRETEDSRYVTLTLPRVLARLPYGSTTVPVEEFSYEEVDLDSDGKAKPVDHDDYCWMNAAYVLGSRLTNAFAQTGWCTAIRGVENGGKVDSLPAHVFKTEDGDEDMKCPTEVGIGDRREAELSKQGFLPLCHFKNTDYSVFMGAQSTQVPKDYGPKNPNATANAAISARLPYIMASSRIAHFLKVIARDKIGGFMEASDCKDFLTRWIADYVCADDKPSAEMKARYPLAEAAIDVQEIPGQPGAYNAVAHLRPWLQMEELNASLRMVAKLPGGNG